MEICTVSELRELLVRIEAMPNSALLTEAEAAAFLRLARQTLASDRVTGRLSIPYCRLGRSIRYPKGEVSSWRDSRTVRAAATVGA
jgi:predicted DNA-binding transcriptional regulator AlpA